MNLFLTLLPFLAVLSVPCLAAPMNTTPQDAQSSTSAPQPPSAGDRPPMDTDWSGNIYGWNHKIAKEGPPDYGDQAPPKKPKKARKETHEFVMKMVHPFIVTQDHGQHVEGHVITSSIPADSSALANLPAHYGIQTTKENVQIVKSPKRYALKTDLLDPENFPTPQKLTDENLKKLREDLCKRGAEGGACSLRKVTKQKSAASTPASGGLAKASSTNKKSRKVASRRPLAQTKKRILVKQSRPLLKSPSTKSPARGKNSIVRSATRTAVKSAPRKTRK